MRERLDHKWLRISIFYAVALAMSFLARRVWQTSELSDSAHGFAPMAWHLLSGAGPFVGAILVWLLFRPERRMRYGGSFPAMALAMPVVPALVLGGMGVANGFALEPHLFGLMLGIWAGLYAILEETGWRGYLQDELRPLSALGRYALVGLFWYVWHFSWLDASGAGGVLVGLGILILASIGIGFVADRTHSILAASAFHTIGNILGLTAAFPILIPSFHTRSIVALVCVAIWLVMLRVWRMRDNRIAARGLEA